MFLKSLELVNFRNLTDFKQKFTKRTTLIVGANGSGKSSLLEAVFMLGYGASFRAKNDREVISWESDAAYVAGSIEDFHQVSHRLTVKISPRGKFLGVNGKGRSLLDFMPYFVVVSFSHFDLNLLEGRPAQRRRFLDRLLSLLHPEYLLQLAEFNKALKNRNILLRRGKIASTEYALWNDKFAALAGAVFEKRIQMIAAINQSLASQNAGLEVKYLPSLRLLAEVGELKNLPQVRAFIQREMAKKIKQIANKEALLGFSMIGPQRDDFEVRAVRKKAFSLGIYGSRGEQRLAVIKLKKAQLALLEEKINEKPVFLLDDVFSELDRKNRTQVLGLLDNYQSFVTSAIKLPVFEQLNDQQLVQL